MDVYQHHADGVKEVMDLLEGACPVARWDDQAFRILTGSTARGKLLGLGGFGLDTDLQFVALMAELPPPAGPQLQDVLQVSGRELRVQRIVDFAGGKLRRFVCVDVTQGV